MKKKIIKPIKIGKKAKKPVVKEPVGDIEPSTSVTPVAPEVKKIIYAGKEVIEVEDVVMSGQSVKKVYLSDGSIEVVEPGDFEARISKEEKG
jgi:hypothetical protein